MIQFIIGAMVGAAIGCLVGAFFIGSSLNNREHDAYMRGYADGKKVQNNE